MIEGREGEGKERMEKERGHYRAYEGFKPANNGNTSSLKRSTAASDRSKTHPSRQVRCLCFGGVPDKASHHSFLKGCVINLGICALLVAYTLLGSFIFLAIEGGTDDAGILLQQRSLAMAGNQPGRRNTTAWLKQVSVENDASIDFCPPILPFFLSFSFSLRFDICRPLRNNYVFFFLFSPTVIFDELKLEMILIRLKLSPSSVFPPFLRQFDTNIFPSLLVELSIPRVK